MFMFWHALLVTLLEKGEQAINPFTSQRCFLALLQTEQTQIRQLLLVLSDQGLLCLWKNMIRYDPTIVDLTSNFVPCTNTIVYYIIIHSG